MPAALAKAISYLSKVKAAAGALKNKDSQNIIVILLAVIFSPILIIFFIILIPVIFIGVAIDAIFNSIFGFLGGVLSFMSGGLSEAFAGFGNIKAIEIYAAAFEVMMAGMTGTIDDLYNQDMIKGGVDIIWMESVLNGYKGSLYDIDVLNKADEASEEELKDLEYQLSLDDNEIVIFTKSFFSEKTITEEHSICDPLTDEQIESGRYDCSKTVKETKNVLTFDFDHDQNFQKLRENLGWEFDAEKIEYINSLYTSYAGYVNSGVYDPSVSINSLISEEIIEASLKKEGFSHFISPVPDNIAYSITSEFGKRDPIDVGGGNFTSSGHKGTDFAYPFGSPIRAVGDGEVIYVRNTEDGYGMHLIIDHGGGLFSLYGHCSTILVGEGDKVSAGDIIARVGSTGYSTGPHLHLEMLEGNKAVNSRKYIEF